MNNTDEKLLKSSDLVLDAEELIQLIKKMDKEKLGKSANKLDEKKEAEFREYIEKNYKTESDFYNFFSEDEGFSIEEIYEGNVDAKKIGVNSLLTNIGNELDNKNYKNLEGKQDYIYREVEAYKDLIGTIAYRSSLGLKDNYFASVSINDTRIKQEGKNIKINNTTIAGLIIYFIFLIQSDRFYKYHRLYKSTKDADLKDYKNFLYMQYYEKLASYINLKNMIYAEVLSYYDVLPQIDKLLISLKKEIRNMSVNNPKLKEIGEIKERLERDKVECIHIIKRLLDYNINEFESVKYTNAERTKLKIKLLCKSLAVPTMRTIEEYEADTILEEKEILYQQLSGVTDNPRLREFVDKSNQEQRDFLFSKLDLFRLMIDEKISSSKP